jgi:PAS domain-containing protein
MIEPFIPAAAVFLTSVFSALAVLLIVMVFPYQNRRATSGAKQLVSDRQAVFLFENCELVDATASARSLINKMPDIGSDWDRVSAFLSPKFTGLDGRISDLAEAERIDLNSDTQQDLRLSLERIGKMLRLTLVDLSSEGQGIWVDGLSHIAQENELASLRETLAAAPLLIWRQNSKGAVVWANTAYVEIAAELNDDDIQTWPLPALFPDISNKHKIGDVRRVKLERSSVSAASWYEWYSCPSPDGTMFFAFPADAIVNAETALHEFVQTLTKTFANLPIGLAIFDRNRQLAMFNPALVDLTLLDVAFLSARPSLFDFLDRLREDQMIPEPKNYHSWREQVAALEKAAASGQFEEVWSLATGQTYKVTGQPHPGGALAFQIENISAETTLTRHFRSEIELGHEVFDTLDEAIVVFSPAGELILSNATYSDLWLLDLKSTLGVVSIIDSIRHWQKLAQPSPVWGEIRDFVINIEDRAEWCATVTLNNHGVVDCQVMPLSGGRTLVRFSTESRAVIPITTQSSAREIATESAQT